MDMRSIRPRLIDISNFSIFVAAVLVVVAYGYALAL